jgi:hypothetical protein
VDQAKAVRIWLLEAICEPFFYHVVSGAMCGRSSRPGGIVTSTNEERVSSVKAPNIQLLRVILWKF